MRVCDAALAVLTQQVEILEFPECRLARILEAEAGGVQVSLGSYKEPWPS